MFKQPAHRVRSRRTGGFKVEHVVHLSLLIAVCIWLLYQVQHYPGKNTSGRKNSKVAVEIKGGNENLNLGRKNLRPRTSGDTEQRHNDGNTAGKETSESVAGVGEGTKQEGIKGEDKGNAGGMESNDRNRRGEENANERGGREKHDQENGGVKGDVKENKDQEMPEGNKIEEATAEKHVHENNSPKLQVKGTQENEVVQEGKSIEQSSGNKEEEGPSRSMEERSKKSEVGFNGTTDKSGEVEKEYRASGESTQNSPTSLLDFIEEKSNNSTIASIGNQNDTSGLRKGNNELSPTDDQVDSSVSAAPGEEGTEADRHDAVAKRLSYKI